MYAFDTREKAKLGHPSREWTAVGHSEEAVVREMSRCLQEDRRGQGAKAGTHRNQGLG